jgi:hypothetical protein
MFLQLSELILVFQLLNQTSLARDLNGQVQTDSKNLFKLLTEWNSTHAQFLSSIANITAQFGGVYRLINQTQVSFRIYPFIGGMKK